MFFKRSQYWLIRVVFLRCLAFIDAIAFAVLFQQYKPLLGERGLLPVKLYLQQIHLSYGTAGFWQVPSLFWFSSHDSFALFLVGLGFVLSAAALCGALSAAVYFLIWLIYLSFVNVGQVFYGFGWESMMLEAGFLAIFLCGSVRVRPYEKDNEPPAMVIWFLRWMLFRVMFGAGLIKIRGDACWLDLSCLQYHYETQPIPNPLSWYFDHFSEHMHRMGVIFTHFVELGVPWGYFGPRTVRHVAGLITIIFQVVLILSGNLSWLNYLTIVIALACFDDSLFGFLGQRLSRSSPQPQPPQSQSQSPSQFHPRFRRRRIIYSALTVVILFFSVQPALNLFSSSQVMNASFDPFHLVNTYGAFGSIERVRNEIILSGTTDADVDDSTQWTEYNFKCKPGDVMARPCLMSPYHYRLDWQMWFAAMSDYRYNEWLVHLVYKLLQGDSDALSLLAGDPFHGQKPKFIKADLYQYHFTDPADKSGAWWKRSYTVPYLPPLSPDNPSLRHFITGNGWEL